MTKNYQKCNFYRNQTLFSVKVSGSKCSSPFFLWPLNPWMLKQFHKMCQEVFKKKNVQFIHFQIAFYYASKSLRPQVLYHFGNLFWSTLRCWGQQVTFQVILNDFLGGQDPFTKSSRILRILRPEPWNFVWGLVWTIDMLEKNRGSIQDQKVILDHPNSWRSCLLDSILQI